MSAARPLEGVRVVEMSHMIMGPSCGMFLAFMGAEVIKIEPPGGDKTRDLSGMGRGFFPTFNRGKKSVTLDIKTSGDRDKLHKLLEGADVFVENFRDESLEKMGLAPSQLRERYPQMILASCKGFLHGPYETRTAMDEVVQMMTGMAYMTGPTGRPLRIGSSANDIMAGLFGAFAVVSTLLARERDGEGHALRVGLFENCLFLVSQHMVQFDLEGTEEPPMPERNFSWAVYDIFETQSGKQMFVSAVTEGHWNSLCKILGLEQLLADERLQTRPDQIRARSWTLPIFAEAIKQRSFESLAKEFEAAGLSFAPIARPAEMYDDPHVNRPNGLFESVDGGQTFRAPGLPIEIDGDPFLPVQLDLPEIGQHNAEFFKE